MTLLLQRAEADPLTPNRHDSSTIEGVLFAKPFHLDHFPTSLAANGWRFIAAVRSELGIGGPVSGYLASRDSARLDETVSRATLAGYTALTERMREKSHARLENMLSTHQMLFFATLAVIVLVALFIFRPMANVIMRRTHELVDARNSMAFIAVHDGLTGLLQPHLPHRPFRRADKGRASPARTPGRSATRSRPFQADQRHARPRRGRLRAGHDRAAYARVLAAPPTFASASAATSSS